jgi:hypothetical protein
MLGILKSRQPVAETPETLQNMQQGKLSATRLLYQVLGPKEPEIVGSKASKVAYEDNEVYLHNELTTSNNVPTKHKNVPRFSVIY